MASTKNTNKKRNRSRIARSSGTRNYSQLYKDDKTQLEAGANALPQAAAVPEKKIVNWQKEYSYVLNDLRTLVIVSILIFIVMIGAGYLI
ncbi:hypothetical protein KFU94_51845 [Chloroflexi bacterium TSY]|nr:hypothetical protein [Chloroflexi bacterium TSY]